MIARILSLLLVFAVASPTAFAQKKKKKRKKGEMDPEVAEQVYNVLERANRSGDAITRALATEHFGSLRPKDTKSYAVDALKDPVFEVRAAAIRALIRLGDKAANDAIYNEMTNPRLDMEKHLGPLLSMLSDKDAIAVGLKLVADPKATTTNAVIAGFAKMKGPRMLGFFKALTTDKNQALAEGVQNVILTLRSKAALPLYEQVLKVGTPAMQQRALQALTEYPRGTELKFVRKLLKSKDAGLKTSAAEVLAHHGDKAAVKALLPALSSADDKKIVRALKAMAMVAGPEVYPHLAGFLRKKSTNPDIIKGALEIHYRSKSKQIVDILRKLRKNDNIRTQAHAVYYMGVIEKGRALPMLHEDLFHGDPNVRKAAIQAVGNIASRESVPYLKKALDNSRARELRIELVKALANIKDKSIVHVVSFLITDSVPEVRRWAIIALTRVRHTAAVSSLRIAVNDSNLDTRAAALKAIIQLNKAEGITAFRIGLGWLRPQDLEELADTLAEQILPYLDMAVGSSKPELRAKTIEILKRFPKHESTVLATALARTRSNAVKVELLNRLAERNGAAELPRLQPLTDSRELVLKVAALRLLGSIGDLSAETILRKALFDSQERARVTAAVSLLQLYAKKPKKQRKKRRKKRK